MLRAFSALLPCRIAAALLILALSGAAGLAPRARAAEHRCQCQGMMVNGRHVCSCPICRLAALRAAARDRAGPASRRQAAMKALDDATATPESGGSPCYSSQCDHSGNFPGTRPGTEPFALPKLPELRIETVAIGCGDVVSARVERDSSPELPPPRSHRS